MSDDLHQTASGKRRDVISWDEFFMSVAIAAQRRSKDPNTQVGACIASTNHRILSVGYNGTPSALNDDFFPWGTSDDPLQDKHNYVVHAEANAVLNYRGSLKDLEGSTVYVTLFPCHDCAKIIQVYKFTVFSSGSKGSGGSHYRVLKCNSRKIYAHIAHNSTSVLLNTGPSLHTRLLCT